MMSRRNVLAGAAVVDGKTALSPDQALELLIEGNRNFLNDVPTAAPVGRERRLEIAQGQAPFAAYVTCSDSRVSPEILSAAGWANCSSSAMRATPSIRWRWARSNMPWQSWACP